MIYRRLLGLVLATLMPATLLLVASSTPAAAAQAPAPILSQSLGLSQSLAVDPKDDFPHLPRHCASRKDLIPQYPVKCNLNRFDRSRPTVVLWGDSHAWQLIPGLRKEVKGRNVNLVAFMLGSCPAMDNRLTKAERRRAPGCLKSNAMALDYVKRLKRQKREFRIVLATYWRRYLFAIRKQRFGTYHGQMAEVFEKGGPRLFRTLGRLRVPVDVVGQAVSVPPSAPNCRAGNDPYACNLPRFKAIREEKGTRRWVQRQMRPLAGPGYVDINRMCVRKTCYARGPGGIYTFFDVYHITASMSRQVSFVFYDTVTRAGGTTPGGGGDSGSDGGGGCPLIILC